MRVRGSDDSSTAYCVILFCHVSIYYKCNCVSRIFEILRLGILEEVCFQKLHHGFAEYIWYQEQTFILGKDGDCNDD
jgi:hypothetical protein